MGLLEDVLTPSQRKTAYKIYKWMAFLVGLASTVIAAANWQDAQVLLWLVVGNAGVNFIGSAIGQQADANTHTNGGNNE